MNVPYLNFRVTRSSPIWFFVRSSFPLPDRDGLATLKIIPSKIFYIRQFYSEYSQFIEPSKILHAVRGELKKVTIERSKSDALRRKSKITKKEL